MSAPGRAVESDAPFALSSTPPLPSSSSATTVPEHGPADQRPSPTVRLLARKLLDQAYLTALKTLDHCEQNGLARTRDAEAHAARLGAYGDEAGAAAILAAARQENARAAAAALQQAETLVDRVQRHLAARGFEDVLRLAPLSLAPERAAPEPTAAPRPAHRPLFADADAEPGLSPFSAAQAKKDPLAGREAVCRLAANLPPVDVRIVAGPFRTFSALTRFGELLVSAYGSTPIHRPKIVGGWVCYCLPCPDVKQLAVRLASGGESWLEVAHTDDQQLDVTVFGEPPGGRSQSAS